MPTPLAVTADNRGPLVSIATWLTLVAMVIMTLTKIATKWTMVKRFQADDGLMVAAMFAGIAQALAAWQQVANGLGQHQSALGIAQYQNYEKATYAARVLYIVTTNLAKMAVLHLLASFTRTKLRRRTVQIAFGFTALWTAITVLIVLFECATPETWNTDSGRCMNLLAFWTVYAVVDILVLLVVGLFPVFLFWELHTKRSKKLVAMGAFTPILLTIPLVIVRLVFLFADLDGDPLDFTYDSFNTALIMEIHAMFSVIAACFPFTKPLIDSLSTGLLTSDLRSATERSERRSRYFQFGLASLRSRVVTPDHAWLGPSVNGDLSSLVDGNHELSATRMGRRASDGKMMINKTVTTTIKFEGDGPWRSRSHSDQGSDV